MKSGGVSKGTAWRGQRPAAHPECRIASTGHSPRAGTAGPGTGTPPHMGTPLSGGKAEQRQTRSSGHTSQSRQHGSGNFRRSDRLEESANFRRRQEEAKGWAGFPSASPPPPPL